jgi:hypothetical protein
MKHVGIHIPSYCLDRNGKLKKSTRSVSASKRIAMRESKRITPKRGKRIKP